MENKNILIILGAVLIASYFLFSQSEGIGGNKNKIVCDVEVDNNAFIDSWDIVDSSCSVEGNCGIFNLNVVHPLFFGIGDDNEATVVLSVSDGRIDSEKVSLGEFGTKTVTLSGCVNKNSNRAEIEIINNDGAVVDSITENF